MRRAPLILLSAILLPGLSACQTYLGRMAMLRGPDVEDYRKLPSRAIAASTHPIPFVSRTDTGWVARLPFEAGGTRVASSTDLDAFLSSRGTTAFLLVHDGVLVDERYYKGNARDSLFKSFSMSKSVLSALLGIAQSEGVLRLSDSVGQHIPVGSNRALAPIRLEHLADNVSGFRYRRGNAPWKEQPRMYYTTDARAYVRGASLARQPGSWFEPEDISPLLLGYVLERALQARNPGMTLSRYAEERLWVPMGAAYPARWVVDRAGGGLEKTESGLVARAVDLARFGQLYLDGGRVAGRQVVPAAWVDSSTSPPDSGAANLLRRGFHRRLWWGRPTTPGHRPDFYANGHFGQRIYVSPRARLVVVRLGSDNGNVDWTEVLERIAKGWPVTP